MPSVSAQVESKPVDSRSSTKPGDKPNDKFNDKQPDVKASGPAKPPVGVTAPPGRPVSGVPGVPVMGGMTSKPASGPAGSVGPAGPARPAGVGVSPPSMSAVGSAAANSLGKGGPGTQPAAVDKEKKLALDRALQQIDKAFGKGSIMRLDEEAYLSIPGISTGALSLDLALGGKGIPRGRIVEVFGPESSGKTTLALTVAAQAQRTGGVAAFIDAEHALDPSWARKIGVNIDDLLVSQPDCGEQALEICELLVRSNAVDVIVVDSVAALIPKAEIEGEMGDAIVGVQARLMSQAMRKLTGVIARSNCTVIFINQIREKIGVMFGSPETTPGGRALKFYSSVRIDVRRIGAIKDGEVTVGSRTRARVVKNKVAPPFREAEFDIMYDEGVSGAGDLLDLAVEVNVVAKSGSWFSYGELRIGQGREASKAFLKENAELSKEIRQKVLAIRTAHPVKAARPSGNDDGEE